MHVRKTLLPLALAAMAGLAPAQTFSDEAQWQAAVGNFQTEDFEGFANLTTVTQLPTVLIYMNRLNTGNTAPTVMSTSTTGGTATSGSNVLVNQSQAVLPGLGPIRLFSTVPGLTIKGMGYWNTGGDDSTVMRFYDPAGNLIIASDTGTNSEVFNGIVTTNPVGWVEIDAGSIGNGYITLDDLQVAYGPMPDIAAETRSEWRAEESGLGTQPATASTPGPAQWSAAPGAIGVVRAFPGAPQSPSGWAGPIGTHPLSLHLAVIRADVHGNAPLPLQRYAQALGNQASTWTLQVLWAEPGAAGVEVVPGEPRALSW